MTVKQRSSMHVPASDRTRLASGTFPRLILGPARLAQPPWTPSPWRVLSVMLLHHNVCICSTHSIAFLQRKPASVSRIIEPLWWARGTTLDGNLYGLGSIMSPDVDTEEVTCLYPLKLAMAPNSLTRAAFTVKVYQHYHCARFFTSLRRGV